MNIFTKHDWFAWERSLQIMQNRWVAHFTNEASICETWYIMTTTVNLENLISSLNSDSQMS